MKALADSIEAALKSVVTAAHKGVYVINPFTYPDQHGTAIVIESVAVSELLRELKIWAFEKLEEVSVLSKQKMYEAIEKKKNGSQTVVPRPHK